MDFQGVIEIIYESLTLSINYLLSPGKRVFIPYLISSLIIAFFVYLKIKSKLKLAPSFFKYIFHKKIWLSQSARIDYYMVFFNGFIKVIVVAPFLIYTVYIAYGVNNFLIEQLGESSIHLTANQTVVLYSLSLLFIGDFVSFLLHYLMHKIPFLWEFHKIHHSAKVLNPFTQYRIHPVELILQNIRGIIVKGSITGLFIYMSEKEVTLLTFLGVSIFNFLFLVFGANLRHSHVPFKYNKWIEYIIISPFQHQIHHSNNQALFDSNLGSKLAVWDWAFGTLIRSKAVKKITFGLGNNDDDNYTSFFKNIIAPFKNLFHKLIQ